MLSQDLSNIKRNGNKLEKQGHIHGNGSTGLLVPNSVYRNSGDCFNPLLAHFRRNF